MVRNRRTGPQSRGAALSYGTCMRPSFSNSPRWVSSGSAFRRWLSGPASTRPASIGDGRRKPTWSGRRSKSPWATGARLSPRANCAVTWWPRLAWPRPSCNRHSARRFSACSWPKAPTPESGSLQPQCSNGRKRAARVNSSVWQSRGANCLPTRTSSSSCPRWPDRLCIAHSSNRSV